MEAYLKLEAELAKWSRCENVVTCSSGTAALHLGLESLGLKQGSEVLVPDFSMVACPRSIIMSGLVPVFVDCNNDMNIDTRLLHIKQSVTEKTKAIMAVHTYGRPVDMDLVLEVAYKYDLYVIEDMAELHGTHPHRSTDVACWSFYKNKIVHGEEGGAVAFLEGEYADRARSLKNLGFNSDHDYTHIPRGNNYRLSNVHASLILESLAKFRGSVAHRRELENIYNTFCPNEYLLPPRESPWVYDIRIPGMTYAQQMNLVNKLRAMGIQARHAFKPNTIQPEFVGRYRSIITNDWKASIFSREVIYLPLGDEVTLRDIEKTFEVIDDFTT